MWQLEIEDYSLPILGGMLSVSRDEHIKGDGSSWKCIYHHHSGGNVCSEDYFPHLSPEVCRVCLGMGTKRGEWQQLEIHLPPSYCSGCNVFSEDYFPPLSPEVCRVCLGMGTKRGDGSSWKCIHHHHNGCNTARNVCSDCNNNNSSGSSILFLLFFRKNGFKNV